MSEPEKPVAIHPEELRKLIRTTVDETLTKIGINPDQVGEMQRDFIYLRTLRQTHEQVKIKVVMVVVGTLVTATIGILMMRWRG